MRREHSTSLSLQIELLSPTFYHLVGLLLQHVQLSNCDGTLLAAGTLASALQVEETTIRGILIIVELGPIRFQLVV
ncbi:hypothetical protein Hanom_Chr03g00270181 [Helianthus anomalus]